jgi:hypothetical protein
MLCLPGPSLKTYKKRIKTLKTIIILYVALYGCEQLGPSFQRKNRDTQGAEEEAVEGSWRKLHHQEFHNLYASPVLLG